jgi:hypothetical protein
MNFDDLVSALDSLEGAYVTASVSGDGSEAAPLMSADCVLRRMQADDASPDPSAVTGEEAIVFVVGTSDTTFSIWPSRFLDATSDVMNGVAVMTLDGRLRVYRNRRWID